MPVLHIDPRELERVAEKLIPGMRAQVPFAAAYALNGAMFDLRKELQQEMQTDFDRPTPYVTRSLLVKRADKHNIKAELYAEDFGGDIPPAEVIEPHISGGTRRMRRSEERFGSYWVPASGAPRDRYGNVSGAEMMKILSIMQIAPDANQWRIRLPGQRSSTAYFRRGNVLYQRVGRRIKPFLIFISSAPRYKPRLDWQEKADEVVAREFPKRFGPAFEKAVATAK